MRTRSRTLVEFAVAHFGGLHVMFNNAGIPSAFARLLDNDLADFQRVIGVNLFGVMFGTQRAARHMAEHGGGSIINTSSIAALSGGAGPIVYRVSKAAVVQFSRSAAIDLADYSIRVNCIAPGHIATAITNYDMGPVIQLTQPLQRHGGPEDVANAVALPGGRSVGADHGDRVAGRRRHHRRTAGQPAQGPDEVAGRSGDAG